jgi:hypothetical protein
MAELKLAQVVYFRQGSNTADIKMLENGWPYSRVPIMCETVSSNTGRHELPQPSAVTESSAGKPADRVMIAVVGMISSDTTGAGSPVILGFLPPQNRETLFTDGRCINRLPSDVYVSVDDDGNIEVAHPSGTYIRIGETPGHEDLTGQDFNGAWKIRRNTDKSVHLKISVGSGGSEKASLHIDPDGNLTISASGTASVQADQVVAQATKITATADEVDVTATTTKITGNLNVIGAISANGQIHSDSGFSGP